MKPKNLAARAAIYIDAIRAARAAGYTWEEIAGRISAPSAEAARKAVARAGKYSPCEQTPLPLPDKDKSGGGVGKGANKNTDNKRRPTPAEMFEKYKI